MNRKRMVFVLINCISLILCGCGGTSTVSQNVTAEKEQSAFVSDADRKYPYCNSRNLYVQNSQDTNTIVQYDLNGKKRQTFSLQEDLTMLYVNDEEIIVQKWKEDEPSVLYSVPIIQTESGDVLDVENIAEITKVGEEGDEEYVHTDEGYLYADKNYVVYISAYHVFYVYDRANKKFIKLKNDPELRANHGFTNECSSILDNSDGEYVVFNTKPFRMNGKNVYGFSVYRLGDDSVTLIDEKCYTAAPYLFWDEEQKVIYSYTDEQKGETGADDVWIYDCKTKEKEILISAEQIRDFLAEHPDSSGNSVEGSISEMYLDGNCLYLGNFKSDEPFVLKYDLSGKETLKMESGLNDCLKQLQRDGDIDAVAMLEGKCLMIVDEDGDEGDSDVRYACFDMETGQYKMVTNEDEEKFYFQCIGWWWEDMD